MLSYETIKLFDLARAPTELRDIDDLKPLQPATNNVLELPLLWFRVEDSASASPVANSEQAAGLVSLSEYLLNRWLLAEGVGAGETVILTWRNRADAMAQPPKYSEG